MEAEKYIMLKSRIRFCHGATFVLFRKYSHAYIFFNAQQQQSFYNFFLFLFQFWNETKEKNIL